MAENLRGQQDVFQQAPMTAPAMIFYDLAFSWIINACTRKILRRATCCTVLGMTLLDISRVNDAMYVVALILLLFATWKFTELADQDLPTTKHFH